MRENRKQERLIRQAQFKLSASVPEIDYAQPRNIQRAQNLLITGPCGSGKTYLACAIGHNACMYEHSVRYFRLSRLMLELTQAKASAATSSC